MLDVSKLLSGFGAPHGTRFPAGDGLLQPVVVWNVTRRCHLHCRHCYASATAGAHPDELGPAEAGRFLDDLAAAGVPALILSGGEPLLRPDLLELARRASDLGLRPALSTSGTPIDAALAARLRAAGIGYVGISLDGIGELHDRFRGQAGAYQAALAGLRHCRDAGPRVGIRFTLSRPTLPHLDPVLELMESERVQRGYVSHLVYVGRAHRLAPFALTPAETRAAVERIVAYAEALARRRAALEVVTGNSDADGVFLYLRERAHAPERAARLQRLLRRRGGNSAGRTIANVDDTGNVHADQFWRHHRLGNVRARPFAAIWADTGDPLLARLRDRRPHVHGRCARCPFFALCGGGSRPRAEALTGDPWASDPACYLTDDELGLGPRQELDHVAADPDRAGRPDPLAPECAAPGLGG